MNGTNLTAPKWTIVAAAMFVIVGVPLCFLGAGTDLDSGPVIESGRAIMDGHYLQSRPPGSPVHEFLVGLLNTIGTIALVNLLSLAAAVTLAFTMGLLLKREGVAQPWLAPAFVAASPWFQIASASTVDFVLSISLVMGAALSLRRQNPWLAGVLCGLAVGARMSNVILVLALVIAESTGTTPRRRLALQMLLTAGLASALAFLPAFIDAGGSLAFVRNDFATTTLQSHLGRAAVKNIAYLGPVAAVTLLFALPSVWAARKLWSQSWVVRFSLVGFVLSEALFIRFPWKLGHLIPAMVCLALLLAEALRDKKRLFVAIVAAQLFLGVVSIEFVQPNVPNAASSARVGFVVDFGPLVVDTMCRIDDQDAAESLDRERIEAVWNCARAWGTGP